jgi:superfamily II DNA/RNA helicase
VSTFHDLPLLPSLLASLTEQSLTQPTEIQARTLPALLEGRPVVGVAETGSGKTLAYVLPMLHQLKALETGGSMVVESGRPRGLVLVPGRELGEQVSKVFKSLGHQTRLRVRTVLGGSRKQIARQNVSGKLEVLVATPGRLVQLMDSGELRLDDVRMLVFDEADQILDPGFLPVARRIVDACPRSAQLVFFSATLPEALNVVVRDLFAAPPLRVQTRGSHRVVPTLTTDNRAVSDGRRWDVLRTVLVAEPLVGTLLFANTRKQCERVGEWLQADGIAYASYMGQMDRRERRAELARFREGQVSVLLATDLGGRGLDIERVDRVINVHLPQDINNYLHRVGRTARAGRAGLVINLGTERDQPLLAKLRKRERPPG